MDESYVVQVCLFLDEYPMQLAQIGTDPLTPWDNYDCLDYCVKYSLSRYMGSSTRRDRGLMLIKANTKY